MVDHNPAKLEVAEEVGVELVDQSADDVARKGGWDVVIDCTGAVPAIEDGLTRVRRGGTFQQFGVAAGALAADRMVSHACTLDDLRRCSGAVPDRSRPQAADPAAGAALDPAADGVVMAIEAQQRVHGGAVSASTRAQEGDWALQELERLRVDLSVVCPAGLGLECGLGQTTPSAAAVSQAEVACGQQVIAVAEAHSLGRPALVRIATWREIDSLLVAGRLDEATQVAYVDRGIDLEALGTDLAGTGEEAA